MKRNGRALVVGSEAMLLVLVGCGDAGDGGAVYDGGGPDAVDLSISSDAKLTPDAAVCDQLAAAARAQFQSFLDSTSLLACQLDSDCEFVTPQSLRCFAPCGMLMGAAAISAVTAAGTGFCDQYFGAGCPAILPPCPYGQGTCGCDQASCPLRPLPAGTCGCERGQCIWGSPAATDAAVDRGNGEAAAAYVDVRGIDEPTPLVGGGEKADHPEAGPAQDSTTVDAGTCAWPADFSPTGDEYAFGCWAHSVSVPCQLPAGAVVGPNGVILGPDGEPAADQSCRVACLGSEFSLHCAGEYTWPDSGCQTRTMPAPDPALGCRLLPLPTTSTSNYYCCPCGQSRGGLADASVSVSTVCHE
jgi:hypothetical protein